MSSWLRTVTGITLQSDRLRRSTGERREGTLRDWRRLAALLAPTRTVPVRSSHESTSGFNGHNTNAVTRKISNNLDFLPGQLVHFLALAANLVNLPPNQ